MLENDFDDEEEDEYDTNELDMVKQMIGLNINDKGSDDESGSDEEIKPRKLFSNANKMYDYNTPSSKVILS